MTKLVSCLIASCSIGLLSACSPINSVRPFDQQQADILLKENRNKEPALQMISLSLPRNQHWQKTGNPIQLFPSSESSDHWQEKIDTDVTGYKNLPGITTSQVVKRAIDQTALHCKQIQPDILEETNASITYSLRATGCQNEGNKQIVKVFSGIDAIYMVRYSAMEGKISKTQMDTMSQVIRTAQLVRNPSSK